MGRHEDIKSLCIVFVSAVFSLDYKRLIESKHLFNMILKMPDYDAMNKRIRNILDYRTQKPTIATCILDTADLFVGTKTAGAGMPNHSD